MITWYKQPLQDLTHSWEGLLFLFCFVFLISMIRMCHTSECLCLVDMLFPKTYLISWAIFKSMEFELKICTMGEVKVSWPAVVGMVSVSYAVGLPPNTLCSQWDYKLTLRLIHQCHCECQFMHLVSSSSNWVCLFRIPSSHFYGRSQGQRILL